VSRIVILVDDEPVRATLRRFLSLCGLDVGDEPDHAPPALVITGPPPVERIVEALKEGAERFLAGPGGAPPTLEEVERLHIERVLRGENGNVARAASRLGISKASLYQRLHRWNIARVPVSGP
jgi:transcriptional regulator of acetoin/glycerol metabolism